MIELAQLREHTFPLCLQCGKITFLGGSALETVGTPSDLNNHLRSYHLIVNNLKEVIRRLHLNQFPHKNGLPDAEGNFLLAARYSAGNAPALMNW